MALAYLPVRSVSGNANGKYDLGAANHPREHVAQFRRAQGYRSDEAQVLGITAVRQNARIVNGCDLLCISVMIMFIQLNVMM
jgi:hypothetical protein